MTATEQRVVDLLGGVRAFGTRSAQSVELDDEIRRGFRPAVFANFKARTGLSNAALGRMLCVSARTIDRLEGMARMKPALSDRLYRVARIFALAEEVLEDRTQAGEWLASPQAGLGGRVPLESLETEAGTRAVEDELLRIEHGFVA